MIFGFTRHSDTFYTGISLQASQLQILTKVTIFERVFRGNVFFVITSQFYFSYQQI